MTNKPTSPDGTPASGEVASSQTAKTAMELTLERVGPCGAVACRDRCAEFAYYGTMDHFAMCVCGHTQQSHSRSTA